jgi:hypothetical protein
MINSRSVFLQVFLLISTFGISQDFLTADYDWPEDPNVYTCPDSLKNEAEVTLFRKSISEFGYKNDAFVERYIMHWAKYLSADRAIEENNRIYLPVDVDETLELTKARVINPDGEIILLDKNDINSSEDEAGNITYYFAFKGLEKESIIEVLFIYYIPAQYSGARLILQNDIPQLNVSFEIISPAYLVFDYLGKNGFGEMESDTSDKSFNHLVKRLDFIAPFKAEEEAFVTPNLLQVIYKLDENLIQGENDVINYNTLNNNVISNFTNGTKKEKKIVSNWIKEAGIDKVKTEELKLRKLEVYLKKLLAIFDAESEDLENIEFINDNKVVNSMGFIKIMALASEQMNIQYEIVVTTDRSNLPFDPDFEAYNYLQDFLMYFPDINKYLDPNSPFGVLGITPVNYHDNYGVFYKKSGVDKLISGSSEIKYIKGIPAADSHHDMLLDVSIANDFSGLEANVTISATGYFAAGLQPYYDILEPEEIEEFNIDQVEWISENMEVNSVEAIHPGFENLGINPFIIEADFTTVEYLIKARNKYIVKLGLLIGPQVEMYQDSKRTLPVDMGYRKVFHREINFTLPNGFKIENPEDLIIDVSASDKDGVYAGFKSIYTLNGNKLTVKIDEFYNKVHFAVEEFEDYRKVINSAADFNKIVLYLEENGS